MCSVNVTCGVRCSAHVPCRTHSWLQKLACTHDTLGSFPPICSCPYHFLSSKSSSFAFESDCILLFRSKSLPSKRPFHFCVVKCTEESQRIVRNTGKNHAQMTSPAGLHYFETEIPTCSRACTEISGAYVHKWSSVCVNVNLCARETQACL